MKIGVGTPTGGLFPGYYLFLKVAYYIQVVITPELLCDLHLASAIVSVYLMRDFVCVCGVGWVTTA